MAPQKLSGFSAALLKSSFGSVGSGPARQGRVRFARARSPLQTVALRASALSAALFVKVNYCGKSKV